MAWELFDATNMNLVPRTMQMDMRAASQDGRVAMVLIPRMDVRSPQKFHNILQAFAGVGVKLVEAAVTVGEDLRFLVWHEKFSRVGHGDEVPQYSLCFNGYEHYLEHSPGERLEPVKMAPKVVEPDQQVRNRIKAKLARYK
jgi:hypothetical protein